jgi:hypothetical protein
MKSALHGRRTSAVEVTNVSPHGFWLLLRGREVFLSFDDFPWFRDAPIGKLSHVRLLHSDHIRWPELDVDLALESIEHPERYPLKSRVGLNVRSSVRNGERPAGRSRRSGRPR